MRPAFAAIINTLRESDWVMNRVNGALGAPAQAIDASKNKAIKSDQRKRMKKAVAKQHGKRTATKAARPGMPAGEPT